MCRLIVTNGTFFNPDPTFEKCRERRVMGCIWVNPDLVVVRFSNYACALKILETLCRCEAENRLLTILDLWCYGLSKIKRLF
jgi:hypothetical protein